jgi:ribosomal protein S13
VAIGRAQHRRGKKAAAEVLKQLDGDEFRKAAQLTDAEMATIRRICSGKYVRNAAAIMNAIRMRVEYAYAKPAQGFDITVTDEREEPTDEEWEALTQLRHQVRGKGAKEAGDAT